MTDRKKRKAKIEAPSNKLTKEEDAIARYVRFNCPTNKTMFEGNEVHYFVAKKAIDTLVESKKYGAKAKSPKFPTPNAAEDFLRSLLERGLFFRARKIVLKKKDKTPAIAAADGKKDAAAKRKESTAAPNKSPKPGKSAAKEATGEQSAAENAESLVAAGEEESSAENKIEQKDEEKKRKKKVKLLFHDVQMFVHDPADVYVWVFDPTPFLKKMIGLLMVLGTIVGCLFPLWPDWLRLGIYYLSMTGIILFGVLLGVAFLRTLLFAVLWACTLGRYKLWLLPNLLEDCGFFESFRPAYTHEYVPGGIFAQQSSAASARRKKKRSTAEERETRCASSYKFEDGGESASACSSVANTPKAARKRKDDKSKTAATKRPTASGCENASEKTDADDEQIAQLERGDAPSADRGGSGDQSEDKIDDEQIDEAEDEEAEEDDVAQPNDNEKVRRRNVTRRERTGSLADDDFVIVDSNN